MKRDEIIGNIIKKTGIPGIVEALAERLSGSELNSLLLEVFNRRLSGVSPSLLLKQYQANRFVQPAGTDMIGLLALELRVLEFLRDRGFQPVELSPVAQLGSCAVVAPVDQKKILSAGRNTEVMADATNAIALHIADLKKSERAEVRPGKLPGESMRFSTVHRHTRGQELKGKWSTAHFKIGCLVSSGADRGNCAWECQALGEQFIALYHLFRECFGVEEIWFKIWERGGYSTLDLLQERVSAHLEKTAGEIRVVREEAPGENSYYKGIQFKMMIGFGGGEMEIADGGFVDWTQQLLENGKERLLIAGFGLGRLFMIQQEEGKAGSPR
jgi:hypothetical protein